jgi:hypothetical protein
MELVRIELQQSGLRRFIRGLDLRIQGASHVLTSAITEYQQVSTRAEWDITPAESTEGSFHFYTARKLLRSWTC